jgi:hypothetical protein
MLSVRIISLLLIIIFDTSVLLNYHIFKVIYIQIILFLREILILFINLNYLNKEFQIMRTLEQTSIT